MTTDMIQVYDKKMYKIIKLMDTNELKKLSLYINNKLPYHTQSIINGISMRYRFDPDRFFIFINYCVRKCTQYNYDLLTLLLQIKNDDMYGGDVDQKLMDIDKALIEGYNEYKKNHTGQALSQGTLSMPQTLAQTPQTPLPIEHIKLQLAEKPLAKDINMNDLIEITQEQFNKLQALKIDYHRIGEKYYISKKTHDEIKHLLD